MYVLMMLLGITTAVSGKFCMKKLIGEEWVTEGDCENNSEILSEIIKDLGLRASPQPPALPTVETTGTIPANSLVRLVNGYNMFSGRVEVYYNGTWGTICNDYWDIRDAIVVCRMLGFPNATTARSRSAFKHGLVIIWLNNVQCTGNETSIFNCSKNMLGKHNCGYYEDASAVCTPNVRLVDGNNSYSGRVEVFHEGEWGRVCDDDWDINGANVVCRMLGLPNALSAPHDGRFGQGSGKVWLGNVKCTGTESSVLDCARNSWGADKCRNDRDASAICTQLPVRLMNDNSSSHFGLVEILYYGLWGTVCHTNWDINDANVVCRMLGFSGAVAHLAPNVGPGKGRIWLDNVRCTGTETSILNCLKNPWNEHSCSHNKDASVMCTPPPVRLINGTNSYSGRVEIQYNGTWGTICDDDWDVNDANVICRMFGFANATSAPRGATFGQGTGRIHLNNVRCTGSEKSIWDCNKKYANKENCDHDKDSSVICQPIAVRLVNGRNSYSGRVEVNYLGEWGTVCDDRWDINEANVVCRMLGFLNATSAFDNAHIGQGMGRIWLDELGCTGTEKTIWDCAKNSWGDHDCGHNEDASVVCIP